jgi:hypothetical protein
MNVSDKLNFRGTFRQYDADGNPYLYKIGDVVELKGKKFVALKPTTSKIPGTQEGETHWRSIGGDTAFYISETTPPNANIGDRWFVPSTEILYTFVKEETAQFWVEL